MPKPERSWEVSPHDAIEVLDDNLWAVKTRLPLNRKGDRRMVMARLPDGRIVFYNACPLEEPALREIAAWGKPSFLVLPSNLHMMDGHAFAERLDLQIYGPKQDSKMAARVKMAGTLEDFPTNDTVSVVGGAGMKSGEAVLVVRSPDKKRLSLSFADIFMNVPTEGASLMARVVGFAGGPKVPTLMTMMMVNDRAALKSQFTAWANDPTLTRLIPSHGNIISTNARETLGEIASRL